MNRSTYSLRRLLALVLALVMCSAVFAGCGKTNGDPTEPNETITETATPTDPTGEPTEEATEEPTEPEVTVPPVVMGTVNAGPLNVRSEPYTTADIDTRLDLGTRVEIYEQKIIDGVNWGRIANGWINMNYVTIDGDETTDPTEGTSVENENNISSGDINNSAGANAGVVTADELHIRETASSNAKSLGKYVKGDVINILEKKGTWGRTSKGWVSLTYVKMEGSDSTGSNSGSTGTGTTTSTPGTTTANTMVSNGKTTVLGYGMVSKVTALNVRYGPGTSYDAATYISAGQRLPYYQESGNWVRIKSGWVSLAYFDIITDIPEGAEGTVTTENLNIRAKASSSSKDLGNLKKGDKVTILEIDGNWGKIEYEEDEYGWISLSYVLFDTDTTTTYTTGDGEVTAYQLNVRKKADASSTSLATLEKGDDVTILEVDGKWGKIEYKSGKYGWINLNYVEMDKVYTTGKAVVTAGGLNVRKKADEDSSKLTTLARGDEVTILEVDGEWGKIEYKSGKYGWINLNYVKMTDGDTDTDSDSDSDSDSSDSDTTDKYTVTINKASNGKVTASSTSCKEGTVVTLTAAPSTGYVLDTLTAMNTTKNEAVAISGGKFTMPAGNVNVVATFKKADTDTYKVTVNTVSNGTVSADTTACTAGTLVSLTVTPNSGYVLESLTVKDAANNVITVTDNTFTMPAANVSIAASFKVAKYDVTINASTNGAVSVNPDSYEKGASVTLIVTPDEGYELDTLTVKKAEDKDVTVSKNKFTMPASDVTVSATFKKVQYKIDIATVKNGTVKADKTTYEIGDTITLTVTPADGYEVDTLTVKDASGNEITVTDNAFTAPGSKVTVTVTFKAVSAT